MITEIPSAIKLKEAFFCLSCEAVTNCSDFCPRCGRGKLWPLERWIGRVQIDELEDSQIGKSIYQEVGLASTEKISERSFRKNYWKIVRNRSRNALEVIFCKF